MILLEKFHFERMNEIAVRAQFEKKCNKIALFLQVQVQSHFY